MSNHSEQPHPEEFINDNMILDGLHFLVVDDNADSLFLTTCILESYGVQVTAATSALEALEFIKELKFDMLIFDIAMPDMDGYTLIHAVRNDLPSENTNIPAIALTALSRDDNSNIETSGFQGYINKPLDPPILIAEVMRLLQNFPLENQANTY